MISFEDSSKDKNILYYDKHVDFVEDQPILLAEPDDVISYEKKLSLTEELKYFIGNLDGNIEIADGKSGLEVVKALETVQELIENEN